MKGCICPRPPWNEATQKYDWIILPECEYHRQAAERPWDHNIPWNCPTFWDGCNCEEPLED